MDDELVITDLSNELVAALQHLAYKHGCTIEDEAYRIIKEALGETENAAEKR